MTWQIRHIAVIAHDAMKPLLAEFLKEKQQWLPGADFLATGRTAEAVEAAGVEVRHMSKGKYGGYREITEMVRNGEVDIVIFFRDHNVTDTPHEDITELLKTCNIKNIPLATNPASAELLILGLIKSLATKKIQSSKQY